MRVLGDVATASSDPATTSTATSAHQDATSPTSARFSVASRVTSQATRAEPHRVTTAPAVRPMTSAPSQKPATARPSSALDRPNELFRSG